MTVTNVERHEVPSPASRHVQHALDHVAHLLPDQAPIRVFIHHNPLHAFQHLHFHEAVKAAQVVYGAEPYLSEAAFREKLRASRMGLADLRYALHDQYREATDAVLVPGRLTQHALRMLMLRAQLHRESDVTLAWHRAERALTRKLRSDVPSEARKALLMESTRRLHEVLQLPGEQAVRQFARLVTGELTDDRALRLLADEHGVRPDARALSRALQRDPEPFCASALFVACQAASEGYQPHVVMAKDVLPLHRDLVLEALGIDIHDVVLPELIRWCAAYLDEGLAHWNMPCREQGYYRAVRRCCVEGSAPAARHARVAREAFRVQLAGDWSPMAAVLHALAELGVGDTQIEPYIERLLLCLPGWAGMMSRLERKRDDRPNGGPPASLLDMLAVQLTYELAALAAPLRGLRQTPKGLWENGAPRRSRQVESTRQHHGYQLFQVAQLAGLGLETLRGMSRDQSHAVLRAIEEFDALSRRRVFQEAFEHRHRTELLDAMAAQRPHAELGRPAGRRDLQLICCFDEREESFRRHVEEVHPNCSTYGAPGFFGAAIRFRALDQAHHVPLAPVVIDPVHHVDERARGDDVALFEARRWRRRQVGTLQAQLFSGSRSLWRGMLLNAALGSLAALPLLVRILSPRAAGKIRRFAGALLLPSPRTELTVHQDDDAPLQGDMARGFKVNERVTRVATVLENLGLVSDFAPVVLVLGHGSTTLNNPHKSAYDCGACGGRQGGPNARVFANMANTPEVRAGLAARGIAIPDDTCFVGGQHDTCNDDVTLFDVESLTGGQQARLATVMTYLSKARARNAQERCRRLFSAPRAPSPAEALRHVQGRAEHLAEPRPEFGHATNAVAIVGRRALTRGLFLDRRAFLISYDPILDEHGSILERTIAAAGPVGAGINLEYYFSHVDNERYGAGSKLPHNVAGLLGVMTGHASDLRTGLPRQMVEIHEPLRLLLVVEAKPTRLLEIAERQPEIRALVVNRWLQLVAMDPHTGAMQHFTDRGFEPYQPKPVQLTQLSSSVEVCRGTAGPIAPVRVSGSNASA